jgi:hypothetical protein
MPTNLKRLAFGTHWISGGKERAKHRCPQKAGTPTGQERTGGACSKMQAPRNGDGTQSGCSAGIVEN